MKIGDKIRLAHNEINGRNTTSRSPLQYGTEYIISDLTDDVGFILVGVDDWYLKARFELVEQKFSVGDRVVLRKDANSKHNQDVACTLSFETIYTITKVGKKLVDVSSDGQRLGSWYADRFELAKETTMPSTMVLETARSQRDRLHLVYPAMDWRVRSLYWDTHATMGAVVCGPIYPYETIQLYSVQDVDNYIAAQTPTDLIATVDGYMYTYTIEGKEQTVPYSVLYTTHGIVTHNGKKYRIGTQQFVPVYIESK